eukprot:scaffold100896_cov57-Phaeocystis_antarctica.AAC.3
MARCESPAASMVNLDVSPPSKWSSKHVCVAGTIIPPGSTTVQGVWPKASFAASSRPCSVASVPSAAGSSTIAIVPSA